MTRGHHGREFGARGRMARRSRVAGFGMAAIAVAVLCLLSLRGSPLIGLAFKAICGTLGGMLTLMLLLGRR